MAATASASSSAPRYAPEDPTLPKPWRGLVDGNTGYLYYWNPETDVTQYERPVANSLPGPPLPPPPPLPPKSTSVPISSSVHIQHSSVSSSQGHHRHNSKEDTGHHNVNSNNGPKLAAIPGPRSHQSSGSSAQGHHHHHSKEDAGHRNVNNNNGPKLAAIPGARSHQGSRGSSSHTQSVPNGSVNAGHGTAKVHDHGSGSQTLRSSSRVHGSEAGGGSSVESYRRQHEITVSGVDVPAPFMTFESTGFPSEILREVHHAGFSAPTPIQAQSWPVALQGRDIVAIAKTGSGKTLGYLIPGFIHIKRCRNSPQIGPTVLVLSPTRELATQIQDEAMKFGRSSRISCTCLYGGAPKGPQLRDLDRGTDVVVATPGRLNDFLEMRRVSLRQVSYLVLDEADRMLDMGFEPQIRKIVNEIPTRRQTLMYTATWPKDVRKIAADLLVNPVQVNIGSIDELVANKAITQYVEVLAPLEKQRRLEQILRSQEPGSKVIVFCTTKRTCDQLSRSITRQFGAAAIHGDKSQGERDWVLNQFRTGKSPILVATDVAARGLDIKDIRVVINYDFPTGIEDYVHRIGRTGRAGATGVAYTFFCDQDAKYAPDLIKVLEGAGQRVPSEVRNLAARGRGGKLRRKWGSGSGGRDGGRSRGAGRDDSSHGVKGGRGPLSSSNRSERGRGGRAQDNHDSRDRFDRDHHDGREVDLRGKHDSGLPTDTNERRDRDRVRGRSRSRSPIRGHGRGLRSRSGSQSRSRNQGRSHSRSRNQGRSRSRSRSRDRYGSRGHPLHAKSPRLARDVSPAGTKPVDRVRSPLPDQKQWRSPQYHGEDIREADEPAYLQSPQREKSRSPYEDRERVRSPYDGRVEGSPQHSEEAGEFVASAAWHRHRSPNAYGEDEDEEEEGLIRGDEEEGLIPADEDGRNSPIE